MIMWQLKYEALMQLCSRFHYIALTYISQNLGRFHEKVKNHGLTINWGKTNTMVFRSKPTECKVEVGDIQLEQAKETVCLGVRLSKNGRMESELERRIGRRATVVGSLRKNGLRE